MYAMSCLDLPQYWTDRRKSEEFHLAGVSEFEVDEERKRSRYRHIIDLLLPATDYLLFQRDLLHMLPEEIVHLEWLRCALLAEVAALERPAFSDGESG
jgi:hypothetical protein